MAHHPLDTSLFLVISLIILFFFFAVVTSKRVRENIRRNMSFILLLRYALLHQQNKVQDDAEFSHAEEEKKQRYNDFSCFYRAWLRWRHQQDNDPNIEKKSRSRAQEMRFLKAMLKDNTVINIPLIFCVNVAPIISYHLWAKCVETNTQYPSGLATSLYVISDGDAGEIKKLSEKKL